MSFMYVDEKSNHITKMIKELNIRIANITNNNIYNIL